MLQTSVQAARRLVLVVVAVAGVAGLHLASVRASAPPQRGRQNAADDSPSNYEVVPWPAVAKSAAGFDAPWNFIEVSSLAIMKDGNILLLHRGAHPVMEFTPAGTFIRSWGDGMFSEGKIGFIPEKDYGDTRSHYSAVYGAAGCTSCGAHSVRVDPEGNIWLIDAPGNVVYKMSSDRKELMRIGPATAGSISYKFSYPTDVAFAPNGDFFITDGYGGAHVVKFSKDGKHLLEWGSRGKGPGQFGLPHNVVADTSGHVFVTDRDNQRIEVFDYSGKFLTEWPDTGGVSGLAIAKDGSVWTGSAHRDPNGKVLEKLPASAGQPHGMAVSDTGEVYVGKLAGLVQKFVRH